jgi:hypothetical protein
MVQQQSIKVINSSLLNYHKFSEEYDYRIISNNLSTFTFDFLPKCSNLEISNSSDNSEKIINLSDHYDYFPEINFNLHEKYYYNKLILTNCHTNRVNNISGNELQLINPNFNNLPLNLIKKFNFVVINSKLCNFSFDKISSFINKVFKLNLILSNNTSPMEYKKIPKKLFDITNIIISSELSNFYNLIKDLSFNIRNLILNISKKIKLNILDQLPIRLKNLSIYNDINEEKMIQKFIIESYENFPKSLKKIKIDFIPNIELSNLTKSGLKIIY